MNINEERFNIICKPNENMKNLMKKIKFLFKKKYKMIMSKMILNLILLKIMKNFQ